MESVVREKWRCEIVLLRMEHIFHSQAVQIFPTQQVFPEEAAGQKGAYYNSGGDQRVGGGRKGDSIGHIQSNGSTPD